MIPFSPIKKMIAADFHMSITLGREQYLPNSLLFTNLSELNTQKFLAKVPISLIASLLRQILGDLCITLRTDPPFTLWSLSKQWRKRPVPLIVLLLNPKSNMFPALLLLLAGHLKWASKAEEMR
jgi:hypothetical protein